MCRFLARKTQSPGVHDLEFKAAGRFEDWLNNDTNALVPDLGLRWEPLDDSLVIRVNWQQGFREPSLQELYQTPRESSLSNASFFEPPTPFFIKSNRDLQPEKSRSFNAGFSYSPKFVPGLTISADVFDVEIIGRINTNPSAQELVDRFVTGTLLPGDMVFLDPTGTSVNFLQTIFRNEGREQSRGVDMALEYALPTSFGTFTSRTDATYLDSLRLAEKAQDRATELGGFTTSLASADGYLKWKARSELGWCWKGIEIIATLRYYGGFREQILSSADLGGTTPGKFHWVDATWFFDVQASYDFTFVTPLESTPVAGYSKDSTVVAGGKDGKPVETGQTANYSMPCWKNLVNNTTITLGCNNVFGQDPPGAIGFEFQNAINYPGSLYDATGRFVYASLTKKF
jgi:outer membrane receptor protein involved in Fe transport